MEYITKSKLFLICCFSFIFGVGIASFLTKNILQNDFVFFIGSIFFSAILTLFFKNQKIRLMALIGLFLFLGVWRYFVDLPMNTPDKVWYYNERTVNIIGVISNEPDIRQNNMKLEVRSKKIENFNKDVFGKILITTNLYPRYSYGDEIKFRCKLQAPEKFNNFNYDRYLARYDIYSVCYYPQINILSYDNGIWLYKKIFEIKNKLREIINYGLPEPEAGLARAIILGDKQGISQDLRNDFSRSGISHIISISGMHISILAALFMGIMLGIGISRKKAFLFSTVFLIIYIMLIGLPASAMRAGLMGFLALWALNIGRLNKITNSLVLAGAILLLINPKLLRDDIGFQLSFLAILGIIYFYPVFSKFYKNRKFKIIFNIFAITIAAQIFTLPIISYNFNQVSVIAPFTNLLILWTLPFLMMACLTALFLSLILPNFSIIFFLPAMLLLKYIIFITELLIKLPYAYFEIL